VALLEDLIAEVDDPRLRAALASEARELKQRTSFGLVFERHLPESVLLASKIGVSVDDEVRRRTAPSDDRRLRVSALNGEVAAVADSEGNTEDVAVADLAVVKDFSEPIYPTLRTDSSVERGGDRPPHLVIEGENYHALQLLAYTHGGQADCIYIDPPYNTGARDWTYNNRYVDEHDAWRHSKWLSFMEKRLRLARQLLKPAGVLIVTIDEHEVHHLGVLLEQLFGEANRQLVTIVINPKGVTQGRLSRVEEYAHFSFFGDVAVSGLGDDLLTAVAEGSVEASGRPRWKGLLRSGDDAARADRKDMFYPVLIDVERGAVLGAGDALSFDEEPDFGLRVNGLSAVWPVRKDLSLGRWSVGAPTLRNLIAKGYVALGAYDKKRGTYGVTYLSRLHQDQVDAGLLEQVGFDQDQNLIDVRYIDPQLRRTKTVWHRSSHDAGAYGSDLLRAFLGGERRFSYPKSLYAVRDTLAVAIGEKPDALVIDFFAGSGTTLHSTLLLNALDHGRRRCVLVTNNEVSAEDSKHLNAEGHFQGDRAYEAHGVFEHVARPRCMAAITGELADGSAVPGKYLDGRPYAHGFEENCEFLRLDYLDSDRVELGLEAERLYPLIWLLARGKGSRPEELQEAEPLVLVPESGYAVLFQPSAAAGLLEALSDAPEIEHVFLFTESEQSYAQLTAALGPERKTHMLPRDYLRRFRSEVALRP